MDKWKARTGLHMGDLAVLSGIIEKRIRNFRDGGELGCGVQTPNMLELLVIDAELRDEHGRFPTIRRYLPRLVGLKPAFPGPDTGELDGSVADEGLVILEHVSSVLRMAQEYGAVKSMAGPVKAKLRRKTLDVIAAATTMLGELDDG